MPLLDLTVDLELDGPQQGWTDVTRDVLVRGGVSWDYGLPGSRPHDHVAGIGECRFLLDNSPANGAGLAGYYAPGHPDARPGFELGIACRISLAHDGTVRRKLYYLESVDPSFGPAAARAVACQGMDWIGLAARTPVRDVPVQRAQRTDQILQTILDAIAVTPRAVSLAPGRSTFDYALDDLRVSQARALEALYKVTLSELGYLTAEGDAADGELVRFVDRSYRSRQGVGHKITRARDVVLQRAVTDVVGTVRVGVPLRRVDRGTTTVLYQLAGAALEIPPETTVSPYGPYRDPAQEAQRVGGVDMQPPVAGTDYVATTAADGSGTDVTDQIIVAAVFGAGGVQWTIENPTTETVYLTPLQARGRGIFDYATTELAAGTGAADARHGVLTLTLPYLSDLNVAQSIADYLLAVHGTPRTRPQTVTLLASRDAALAAFAVRVGVHGLCRVVDAPTGVATASHVNRIAYHVASPHEVRLTLDLAYTDQTGMDVWILGMSRLDVNTRLDWG